MLSKAAGARGQRQPMSHTPAAVASPTSSVAGCSDDSEGTVPSALVPEMPNSAGNCAMTMSTATLFMKPASTGCGTYFATTPSRSQPNSICSAPISTTQQEIVASRTARCPGCDSGCIAGSVLKVATAAANSSVVAELRPAAGMVLRPITATTKPPTSDAAPPASMPTGAAEGPKATNASKGSVSQLASVTTAPTEPAITS